MRSIYKYLIFAGAFLLMTAFATPVFADHAQSIQLRPGETRPLNMCKGKTGSIEAKRSGDSIQIIIHNASCATFEIYNADNTVYKTYKIPGKAMPRSGSFTLPKKVAQTNEVWLRVRSNSGKHADWIDLQLAPARQELPLNTVLTMPNCKGTIKIAHSISRGKPQINVVLKGIEKCDTFTIEGNNGRPIGKTYQIQGGKAGKRSASFGLSWSKVIDKGGWNYKKNEIAIRVNGKKKTDLFVVTFVVSGR